MAAEYEDHRKLAASLSHADQLRLNQELTAQVEKSGFAEPTTSILDLRGLGAEIWEGMDAQEYVNRERESWER